MDCLTDRDADGEMVFRMDETLSTELKKKAGFGKGGEKNYSGIVTGLQMQTYLVTSEFRRRRNKKGEVYGMGVAILLPPEAIWGYEAVTAAYTESPAVSWDRIMDRLMEVFPEADEDAAIRLIGKRPGK